MNKPIVLIMIILLIIGAIAVNKIINSSEVDNTQINPEKTEVVVSNPVQNNSNNTSYSDSPDKLKTYVSQR
jgi:hypothetical protein